MQALRYETQTLDLLEDATAKSANETQNRSSSKSSEATAAEESKSARAASVSSLADEYFGPDMDLASFLLRAACENSVIANFLYWWVFLGFSFFDFTFGIRNFKM